MGGFQQTSLAFQTNQSFLVFKRIKRNHTLARQRKPVHDPNSCSYLAFPTGNVQRHIIRDLIEQTSPEP